MNRDEKIALLKSLIDDNKKSIEYHRDNITKAEKAVNSAIKRLEKAKKTVEYEKYSLELAQNLLTENEKNLSKITQQG